MSHIAMQNKGETAGLMKPEEIFGTRRAKPRWWERPLQGIVSSITGLYRSDLGERYANVCLAWLMLDLVYYGTEPITYALFWLQEFAWTSSGDSYQVLPGNPPQHFWIHQEGLRPSAAFTWFSTLSLLALLGQKLAAIGRNLNHDRTYSFYSGKPWIAFIFLPYGRSEAIVKRFFEPTLLILGGYVFTALDLFLGAYLMVGGIVMLLCGYIAHERQRAFLFDMVDGQIEGQQFAERMDQERGDGTQLERQYVQPANTKEATAPSVRACYSALSPELFRLLDNPPVSSPKPKTPETKPRKKEVTKPDKSTTEQPPGFEKLDPALQALCNEIPQHSKSQKPQSDEQQTPFYRIECPNCRAVLKMQDRHRGRHVTCLKCEQRFQVPHKPPGDKA